MNTWRRLGSCLALATLVGLGARGATAQDAGESHPAHIHSGSCAQLGDVVYPLTNVSASGMMAGMQAMAATPGTGMPSAMATPGGLTMSPAMGATTAIPVETSQTLVNASLQDLLSKPYAINVHESQANIQHYIACGDLGGSMMTGSAMANGGVLAIGLKELDNSGESGIALLRDQGNGKTMVWIYLAKGLSGTGGMATPAAGTPSAAVGGTTVPVGLAEMTITPAQTTFKVGQPYTFVVTNQGVTQHEMVIERRGAVDQPLAANSQEAEASDVDPGQTKTLVWTFSEPGAYQLACHVPGHYEAGMVTAITVTP